jgi:hypothetical protein
MSVGKQEEEDELQRNSATGNNTHSQKNKSTKSVSP